MQISDFLHDTDLRGLYYKTFYGDNLRIFKLGWSVYPWQAFPA